MARYGRGYDAEYGGYRERGGADWSRPNGEVGPLRGHGADRRWVGGYREGYQGGSGGIRTGGRGAPGGRDYWWLGEHELRRSGRLGGYDDAYRRFDEQVRPRNTPVGGTYAAMGGRYRYGQTARPLRDDTWFSDWTRYF